MKVHIIGISGKASSAVATMFQDMGWTVTGSDQGVYPPASDYLLEHGIEIKSPYNADNLETDTDLVVVAGNALIVNPDNPEYQKAKALKIPVKSFPQVLETHVVKENSIVVAGNYGKGTISGALVHGLTELGEHPSYMVGGQLVGFDKSLQTSDSAWSVLEGDEYPTPPLESGDEQSKFWYYHPKYLVLTSAEWDHYDKFPTETDYVENYRRLVQSLPPDGLLIANTEGKNIQEIIADAPCKVVTYGNHASADYSISKIKLAPQSLIGAFNKENLTAAYALLCEIGFDPDEVLNALNTFRGLEYRMQKVYESNDLVVVRDLAHSPVKAQAALHAARETWPNHHVIGVFEAFSSSLKTRDILEELSGRFDSADEILVPKVDQVERIAKENRVTGKEITQAIGEKAKYMPKDELLLEHLLAAPKPTVVVFMSSGGIRGIPEEYLEHVHSEQQVIS